MTGNGVYSGHNIDQNGQAHYIASMTKKSGPSVFDQEVIRLEELVERLLSTIDRLVKENRSLRVQQESLTSERAALIEKHDMVRNRVEGIVVRLKSMETGT